MQTVAAIEVKLKVTTGEGFSKVTLRNDTKNSKIAWHEGTLF